MCAESPKPIQAIIPFPPDGPLDRVGRAVVQALERTTGQGFAIDNRAGANGTSGARFVAQSPPDGQTWLFGPDSLVTVNPELYAGRNSFDAEHDLRVVATVGL